jgi:hypothetical protein
MKIFLLILGFIAVFFIIPEVLEIIWETYFQKKWRYKKCSKNKHHWGSNQEIDPKEKQRIMGLIYNASKDNSFDKHYYDNFTNGGYIMKTHTCDWCGKKDWTFDFDFKKLNIEEERDKKIDQILN